MDILAPCLPGAHGLTVVSMWPWSVPTAAFSVAGAQTSGSVLVWHRGGVNKPRRPTGSGAYSGWCPVRSCGLRAWVRRGPVVLIPAVQVRKMGPRLCVILPGCQPSESGPEAPL